MVNDAAAEGNFENKLGWKRVVNYVADNCSRCR
jgi:hypothetical protein